MRISFQLANAFGGASLNAIAAHAMHALRRETEMTNYGNFCCCKGANQFDSRAFNLDCFGACLFYEANGVGEAFGSGAVIAAEGHVGNNEGTADGTADG